jgi:hypothetical protein
MSTSSINALISAARSCVNEAARADRLGQHRYAGMLRQSARRALAELDAIRARGAAPAPVDSETAQRQEKARVYAAILMRGLH